MPSPLPARDLRWHCDPDSLPFDSTDDVEPLIGFAGQEVAVDALRFGIECHAPEQNIFVRGQTGTGRMSIVRRLIEEMQPGCRRGSDLAYVHNFRAPDRPKLLTLPAKSGVRLRKLVRDSARFVREELPKFLTGEALQAEKERIEVAVNAEVAELTRPFERDLREAGLAMVQQPNGQDVQTTIVPLHDGKPVAGGELAALVEAGSVTEAQVEAWSESRETFAKRLGELSREIERKRIETSRTLMSLLEDSAREVLEGAVVPILDAFKGVEGVASFAQSIVDDVIENLGRDASDDEKREELYDVNVIFEHDGGTRAPIVEEKTPTLAKLLGAVDTGWSERGPRPGDFRNISAGSILRANGGYLLLDARELVGEPGAWHVLVRTLRARELEIVPQDLAMPYVRAAIKPEPIPISLRVILVGDAGVYYALDQSDPDFANLFKVLAEFDSEIARDEAGIRQYAGAVAQLVRDEGLPVFDRTAIAALAEHGARVASRGGKLTARISRIADIAREAAFLAKQRDPKARVEGADVRETVRRTKRRADLSSRRFHAMIANQTIIIETSGRRVGQVNGLAVIKAGMLTYGFPARITATIAPGNAGVIDIESSASLSGQIHTKGFHILGGLLRHLLHANHALAFSASLAFEQSYGGIDGDSASGAEICCLLSALTDTPLRQDIAMTGAIDQHGRIQAIGGVNEKIEGFFDASHALGMSGEGGVIIPSSNAPDLMLRPDLVQACDEGRFHIWSVSTVQEALEVFTDKPAGQPDSKGHYPEGTLLRLAKDRARDYWQRSLSSPTPRAPTQEPASNTET